jgi:excisionase family DNA binding protein
MPADLSSDSTASSPDSFWASSVPSAVVGGKLTQAWGEGNASRCPVRSRVARGTQREASTSMSDDVTIDPDGIYLITAAARLLGVSASTLRDLDRQGKIESTRTPGGQRRFTGSALLQLRAESHRVPPRTSRPAADSTPTDADAKARQAWLGQVMARAQRELPADTPAEIRLRLGADMERALGHFGPSSPVDAVEPLVKSLVERARIQGERAQEEAERRAMKAELIDGALAELRRRIDTLSTRVVCAPGQPQAATRPGDPPRPTPRSAPETAPGR